MESVSSKRMLHRVKTKNSAKAEKYSPFAYRNEKVGDIESLIEDRFFRPKPDRERNGDSKSTENKGTRERSL